MVAVRQVILLKGLPASGKSTYARELVVKHPEQYKRVSKDDLRAMLDNGKHSKAREKFICDARDALIIASLSAGYSVIVDDTNLNPIHEQNIRELVADIPGVGFDIVDFTDVSVEECIKRDQKRQNYVGERVIKQMSRQYITPRPTERPAHVPGARSAIICDLDGTLAHLNGRSPYDASDCENDLLDETVAGLIKYEFIEGDTRIILTSGRSEAHRAETMRWLEKHIVDYDLLLMRPEGDGRKDAVVKREMYEQHIKGKYNILYVLDDRNQVVDMWRSLGLKCFQVADGDF